MHKHSRQTRAGERCAHIVSDGRDAVHLRKIFPVKTLQDADRVDPAGERLSGDR